MAERPVDSCCKGPISRTFRDGRGRSGPAVEEGAYVAYGSTAASCRRCAAGPPRSRSGTRASTRSPTTRSTSPATSRRRRPCSSRSTAQPDRGRDLGRRRSGLRGSASRSRSRSPATTARARRAWTRLRRTSRSRTALTWSTDWTRERPGARGASATFKVDEDGDHGVDLLRGRRCRQRVGAKTIRFRIDKTAPGRGRLRAAGRTSAAWRSRPGTRRPVSARSRSVCVASARSAESRDAAPLAQGPGALRPHEAARHAPTGTGASTAAGSAARPSDVPGKRRHAARAAQPNRLARRGVADVSATREGDKWVAYMPNDQSLARASTSSRRWRRTRPATSPRATGSARGRGRHPDRPATGQPGCCTPPEPGIGQRGQRRHGARRSPRSTSAPDPGTIDTKVAAGAVKKVKVKTKLSRKYREAQDQRAEEAVPQARKPRYREQFVSKLKVKYGSKAKIKGTLTTATGAPIAGGTIDVITPQARRTRATQRRRGGEPTAPVRSATPRRPARAEGHVPLPRSRRLPPLRGRVDLLVPGSATLKSSKQRVRNGSSVTFTGKVLGKPLPARGKVVDLQAFYRGKWRTFATPQRTRRASSSSATVRGDAEHDDLQVPGSAARRSPRTRTSSATRRSSGWGSAVGVRSLGGASAAAHRPLNHSVRSADSKR